METRLAIGTVESDDNVYLKVSDLVEIDRIPNKMLEVISKFTNGFKMTEKGLPASGFIGSKNQKVMGIFVYGELGFVEFVGDIEDIQNEELVHIFSNVSEEDYEKIKAYADKELEKIEEEMSNDKSEEE